MRPADFNQYGTRRRQSPGHADARHLRQPIRIKNFMLKGADGNIPEGGLTEWATGLDGEQMSIYDAPR